MKRQFGTLPDGRTVEAVTLDDGTLRVTILTLGAILNDLRLAGVAHGLTLGTPDLAPYLAGLGYYGAVVGPVANRIGGARAVIGGTEYRLPGSDTGNTLHSGPEGLHAQLWTVEQATATDVTLALELADGAGGFPGNRRFTATFALTEPGTLDLTLSGESDRPTLMNLANHSYWNLDGTETYAGHRLTIAADAYLPVDAATLPTGQPEPVEGTPFDFRDGRGLTPGHGARIDHNFCLVDARGPLQQAASFVGSTGVRLRIETTEPGLQVFDGGNDAGATFTGHNGTSLGPYAGLALEAQAWPDAPDNPAFPQIEHGPDTPYRQNTRFRFDQV